MRRALVAASLCFASVVPGVARAWCRSTTDLTPVAPTACNTNGIPLAWARRCLSYSLDVRGSVSMPIEDIEGVLARSFTHWEDVRCGGSSTGIDFEPTERLATCQQTEYNSSGGNVNTIAFVDDFEARMLMTSVFAVTIVWHAPSSGEIYDVDMLVNESLGPYGTCPDTGCIDGSLVDLENVITHEAGHFLGLAHAADEESTMFYEAPRGEIDKRSLAVDDVLGLCATYPPGTLSESCNFRPRHGLDLDCENGSGGRCSVSTARPSRERGPFAWLVLAALGVVGLRRRRSATTTRLQLPSVEFVIVNWTRRLRARFELVMFGTVGRVEP